MKAGHLATVVSSSENDQLTSALHDMLNPKPQVKRYLPWIGFRKGGKDAKGATSFAELRYHFNINSCIYIQLTTFTEAYFAHFS